MTMDIIGKTFPTVTSLYKVIVKVLNVTLTELTTSSGPWLNPLIAKTVINAKTTPITFTTIARTTFLFLVLVPLKTCGVQHSIVPTLTVRRNIESRTFTMTIVILHANSPLAPLREAVPTLVNTLPVPEVLPIPLRTEHVPRLRLTTIRQCGAPGMKNSSRLNTVVGNVLELNTQCYFLHIAYTLDLSSIERIFATLLPPTTGPRRLFTTRQPMKHIISTLKTTVNRPQEINAL